MALRYRLPWVLSFVFALGVAFFVFQHRLMTGLQILNEHDDHSAGTSASTRWQFHLVENPLQQHGDNPLDIDKPPIQKHRQQKREEIAKGKAQKAAVDVEEEERLALQQERDMEKNNNEQDVDIDEEDFYPVPPPLQQQQQQRKKEKKDSTEGEEELQLLLEYEDDTNEYHENDVCVLPLELSDTADIRTGDVRMNTH